MTYDDLAQTGVFTARVPRYTSYPPATAFAPTQEQSSYITALAGTDPDAPLSVYVHIPFCERLCWFCACRTQGVRSLTPVAAYLETLLIELQLVAKALGGKRPMARLHWGGGTPTILSPALIRKLTDALDAVFERTEDFEFSVEIDPTLVNQDKITALAAAGMTRASIGVQDFDPKVQAAIGREQSFETTKDCVDMLRAAGIHSLNIDLVYGLPYQTPQSFAATLAHTHALDPDRIALFGYAHVPHMAKRQRLIPEASLPDDRGRYDLFQQAARAFVQGGMVELGIDHFAKRSDSLVTAAKSGQMHRNFQGYTDDQCDSLIGLGASSISRIGGFFHNETGTATYAKVIASGSLAVARQHVWSNEDILRGRVIEELLCNFQADLGALRQRHGALGDVMVDAMSCAARFSDMVILEGNVLRVTEAGRPVVRVLAHCFDRYADTQATYSRVS